MPEMQAASLIEQLNETGDSPKDGIGKSRRSLRTHQPRYLENALTGNEVFDLLDEYIIDEDGVGSGRRQKTRTRKYKRQNKRQKANVSSAGGGTNNGETAEGATDEVNANGQGARKAAAAYRPRWYNQMYLMFLALRQSPGFTASRSELVHKAVELDEKISKERGLPRAFTGRTPQNSASALLTNNGDGHFIQFRPNGARCYHFKLAYNPGDFESALAAYNEWMNILVEKDWPLCFGTPQPGTAENDDSPALNYDSVPKTWHDIVEVKPSTIPNAGDGLFAVRDLPAGVPLGFYFGVPMTEDEFDSLKEKTGLASHYSIMYRKTVLDATDDSGLPFTDPAGRLYCPFHFMNEARPEQQPRDEQQKSNIVFLEGVKVNQVICLTLKDIAKGEEIFVSYGDEVDRSHWSSGIPGVKADGDGQNKVSASKADSTMPTTHRAGAIRAASSNTIIEASSKDRHTLSSTDGESTTVSCNGISRLLQMLQTSAQEVETERAYEPIYDASASAVLAQKGELGSGK
ncbi:hypothetical protein LPJ81_000656 [Coemansia sp. IMI 209127]|nr:hypothetical protein LPJ81_000656 [Coemansia sp. IMI 209127]